MKRRPSIDSVQLEHVDMVAEPAMSYTAAVHDISRVGEFHIPNELDPGIGPYTINEIEEQLAEADRTIRDASQWSTLNEILTDFKHEHAAWFS